MGRFGAGLRTGCLGTFYYLVTTKFVVFKTPSDNVSLVIDFVIGFDYWTFK